MAALRRTAGGGRHLRSIRPTRATPSVELPSACRTGDGSGSGFARGGQMDRGRNAGVHLIKPRRRFDSCATPCSASCALIRCLRLLQPSRFCSCLYFDASSKCRGPNFRGITHFKHDNGVFRGFECPWVSVICQKTQGKQAHRSSVDSGLVRPPTRRGGKSQGPS